MFHRATTRALIIAIALVTIAISSPRAQQGPPNEPDRTIDARERAEVIEGALTHLDKAYIFADVARKMRDAVTARVAKKEYDTITSARELAEKLTTALQEVSKDKHLRVRHSHEPVPQRPEEPNAEERARFLENARRGNHGFNKVERLSGNVGYLELFGFSGFPEAGETAVAAMNFLANADALIVDLRQNGGGSPAMIGLITSYLFEDRVHLNDFYYRERDEMQQFWTSPHVQGRRFGKSKPVYVLTSSRTFSAAEEFTYNLRNLKRATIVGETSGGGAHPGGVRRINDHFGIWVPSGRAINPITKTNWEGTGVEPDIKVDAKQALKAAHLDALKKLRAGETDKRRLDQFDRAIGEVQKELDAMKEPTKTSQP
jgi:C-terminal processing protease CtpA/Prc